MIHKFTSNDNKGNVNTVEIGSTYTKLGLVAAPVEDTDAANKAYVDSVAGGSSGGGLLVTVTWNEDYDEADLDKTWQEIHDAVVAGKYVSFNEPYSGEGESYINVYHIYVIHVTESNSKPYGVTIFGHDSVYSFLSETTSGTLHYEPIELPDGGLTDH